MIRLAGGSAQRGHEMNEPQRAEQVRLAVSGDRDALQRLIVYYHPTLRAALGAKTAPEWDRHFDPDDVLQQAYIGAFKAVDGCRFDSPGGFYKWIERIALNQLKDHQRALLAEKRDVGRRCLDRPSATSSYPELVDRLAARQSTPSRHLAREEATAAVMSCLARLSDDQRRVVRMRFIEGRPVSEVASELGKSEPAIHMLCHRGLKQLRELMVSITRFLTHL